MTRIIGTMLCGLALLGCRHNNAAVMLTMSDLEVEQALSEYLYLGMTPEQAKTGLREAKLTSAAGEWERSMGEFEEHGHVDQGTYIIGVLVADKYIEWREFGEQFGQIQLLFDRDGRLARVRMWRPDPGAKLPAQNDEGRDLHLDKRHYDKAHEDDA